MITDFIYDGKALSDFGYMVLFENTDESIPVSEMKFSEIKGSRSDVSQQVSYSYENNYSCTFTVIKNLCNTNEKDEFLTNNDVEELTRWLARKTYKWFKFIDDDDDDEIWYQAQFSIHKEYVGDDVFGLSLTLNTNAPFGFTREIIVNPAIRNNSFSVPVYSDEEGYIYPDVVVTMADAGELVITNTAESRETTLKNCVVDEVITFYGQNINQIISTSTHDYAKDFNYNFPRFFTEYGDNTNQFTVNLDCTIKLIYRGIRKVGLH